MRNVAIVEDEQDAADRLRSFLWRYGEERNEQFNVFHFTDAIRFLTNYSANYDFVFMDIELPDLNGMQAAKKLRELDADVVLIFVTNMAQFAVGGYEVGAFDFIVKPVSYANFALKFSRALGRLESVNDTQIWINGKSGSRRVLSSRLKYVEVCKHVITWHTADGDITSSGTMKTVQEMLKGAPFALCNQCYLVNLRHVTEVVGFKAVVGGEELQVSHPKKKEFIRALNLYLNGGGVAKCLSSVPSIFIKYFSRSSCLSPSLFTLSA